MSDQFNTHMKPVSLETTMMRRVGELNKENARLKAEVERIKDDYNRLLVHCHALEQDLEGKQP